ncbi:MAG: DedA family protein [Sneathiellales bacterium]|nr:DedA family protein [Sneathiellales bacterium]
MDLYFGLFASAFLSATLLPGSSEALLSGLVVQGKSDPFLLLLFATSGNVLGSVFNWICGVYLMHFRDRRWFPASPRQIEKVSVWYHKYGIWSLLLAWAPIIGDPLTVVAGLMRAPLPLFLFFVTTGKLARYWLIIEGVEMFL